MSEWIWKLAVAGGLAGCAWAAAPVEPLPAPEAAETAAPLDTLRGSVALVGAEPGARVALRPRDGGAEVYLVGPEAAGARALVGMDVWAEGRLDPARRELRLARVAVRSVDGTAAADGALMRQGGRWLLVLDDGRRLPLLNVPPALQAHEGSRVWIAAPLNAGAGSFGAMQSGSR